MGGTIVAPRVRKLVARVTGQEPRGCRSIAHSKGQLAAKITSAFRLIQDVFYAHTQHAATRVRPLNLVAFGQAEQRAAHGGEN